MLTTQSNANERLPTGEYVFVQAALPGGEIQNIGILLLEPASNRLHVRFRRDIETFAGDEADWFGNLADDIFLRSQEIGGQECLQWMEATLSNSLRISSRYSVSVDAYEQTVQRLYVQHIRTNVLRFRTHLPLFSLEAAAGKFGRNMQVDPEGWTEVWPQIPLTENMFVIHVKGNSMEPAIPDDSLCAFTNDISGSYDGKVVLLEQYGEADGSRYTIKRYWISKNLDPDEKGDAPWLHDRMTLESSNPSYPSWDVASAGKVRVIGEFLFVV